jgi:lysophospholipase L1-like esterase
MRGNPYLLWEYAPGIRVESQATVSINRLGLRGGEPVIPKPPGILRVLATGDSSVYGYNVDDDKVFLQVAARALGEGVQGWNAAIPGYSTFQTINLLEMRALALEPDLVVLGNLWSDNNFDSFVDVELLESYSRFEAGWSGRVHRLLRPLACYRILDYLLRVRRGARAEAREVGWTVGDENNGTGKRRVEVADYARNLDRLVAMSHARGAEVMMLQLPNPRDLSQAGEVPPAWALYRRVMRDTATRHGLPLLDGPRLFQESGLDAEDLFSDKLHPSVAGHALLGEALAAALSGWVAGAPLEGTGSGEARGEYIDPYAQSRPAPPPSP